MARLALRGAGDRALGEWQEAGSPGSGVVHVRRRLTPAEAALVGPVVDVRGTPLELQLLGALFRAVPQLEPILRTRGLGGPTP